MMQCYDVKVKVDTVQNTCSLHGQASLLSFLDADSGKRPKQTHDTGKPIVSLMEF